MSCFLVSPSFVWWESGGLTPHVIVIGPEPPCKLLSEIKKISNWLGFVFCFVFFNYWWIVLVKIAILLIRVVSLHVSPRTTKSKNLSCSGLFVWMVSLHVFCFLFVFVCLFVCLVGWLVGRFLFLFVCLFYYYYSPCVHWCVCNNLRLWIVGLGDNNTARPAVCELWVAISSLSATSSIQ